MRAKRLRNLRGLGKSEVSRTGPRLAARDGSEQKSAICVTAYGALTSPIGATGFEPATSCSRSRRATGLRYAPLYTVEHVKIEGLAAACQLYSMYDPIPRERHHLARQRDAPPQPWWQLWAQ